MNCTTGDIAIIIRDNDFPSNIGAFVKVEGPSDPDAFPGQVAWACQPATPIWSFEWDETLEDWSKTRASCDLEQTNIPDADLKAIRGLLPDKKVETAVKKEDRIHV